MNFLEMDDEHLMLLLKYLFLDSDMYDCLEKSEPKVVLEDGKPVSKEWEHYSSIKVTPRKIIANPSPYPARTVMTTDQYQLFEEVVNYGK